MENKKKYIHSLKILDGKIILDDFEIKGVEQYELKSPAAGTTELMMKLTVNSNVLVNQGTYHRDSDFR